MKAFKDIEQGSEEWQKLRAGVLTGTKLKKIMSGKFKADGSPDKAMEKAMLGVMYQVIGGEFSFDENAPGLGGYLIDQGNELEPIARAKFEDLYGKKVEEIGFCKREDWLGLSPDGLIKTGVKKDVERMEENDVYGEAIEIKCPLGENSANFFKYKFEGLEGLRNGSDKYIWQVVHNFIVNEDLEKLYFVVFNPNISQDMQIHVIEITREDIQEEIDNAETRIKIFRSFWEEHIIKLLK